MQDLAVLFSTKQKFNPFVGEFKNRKTRMNYMNHPETPEKLRHS